MASPFDRLVTTAFTRLPGAIEMMLKYELYETCLDFFRMSDAWRDQIDFTIRANEYTAVIAPAAGRIERLVAVTLPGNFRGIPGAFLDGEGTVRMRHAPTSPEAYVAHVSLTISDPNTRDSFPIMPVDLVNRFHAELLDGLLAKMMSQPAKPYTNTQLAAFHMRRFVGGASRARNLTNSGNTIGSQNWSFPQSFNRRK